MAQAIHVRCVMTHVLRHLQKENDWRKWSPTVAGRGHHTTPGLIARIQIAPRYHVGCHSARIRISEKKGHYPARLQKHVLLHHARARPAFRVACVHFTRRPAVLDHASLLVLI